MAVAQASPQANLDPPPSTPVHRLGEQVFDTVAEIGDVGEFSILTLIWIFRRRPRWSVLVPIFYAIGVQSVSVVAITGTFIGMVLAVQAYHSFQMMGLATRLGSVINISIVKELGPVLAATMLAGRIEIRLRASLGIGHPATTPTSLPPAGGKSPDGHGRVGSDETQPSGPGNSSPTSRPRSFLAFPGKLASPTWKIEI